MLNLKTQLKSFEAMKGSHTIFDYRHGKDPLKATQIKGDMLKHVGATLQFVGANGN